MTDIHSCSYFCDRPECIKAQRDELRDRLAQPEQEPAQRTWVGLTDEEFQWIYDHGRTPAGMIEMAEAKLNEKNA